MTADRPRRLIVVTGTATEIGKTWTSVRLLSEARRLGLEVAARKPAQSFEPGDDGAGQTDAQLLAAASGESPESVCPPHRWYPVPMAPPMAADALGLPRFSIAELADEITWSDATPPDLGLVETAGGPDSPLADDGDTIDLVELLDPDAVVLVADAGLGTINAVRLCADALTRGRPDARTPTRTRPLFVVLNRFDPASDLHRRNRTWLSERLGLTCLVSHESLQPILGHVGSVPK